MEKKLPKVFANKIDKELNNNATVYYDKNEVRNEQKDNSNSIFNVNQKINQIFSSARYVYKADVIITTKKELLEEIGMN